MYCTPFGILCGSNRMGGKRFSYVGPSRNVALGCIFYCPFLRSYRVGCELADVIVDIKLDYGTLSLQKLTTIALRLKIH